MSTDIDPLMASKNGHSVFDIITNGWRRKLHGAGGNGAIGLTLPAEWLDENDVEKGDEVAIREPDEKDGVLELHFE